MNQPKLFDTPTAAPAAIDFCTQVNDDLQSYSRYVCDSRAIPNLVDGLKPVQRRILWTMWKTAARDRFTKTVKVAGMTMAYHPHGNTSIEDAIASMVQGFAFANNYPLVEGEGAFGDVVDPKAIASARYTEVRLSSFAKDCGLFESLDDIAYVPNYDESENEPVSFVPKIPLVLLNPSLGIATGFKCCIPARRLKDVAAQVIYLLGNTSLQSKNSVFIQPWYRHYKGSWNFEKNENEEFVFETGFGFTMTSDSKLFLSDVPENWNREKVIEYLELLLNDENTNLRDYQDLSTDSFHIQLFFKQGIKPSLRQARNIFTKKTRQTLEQHVILPNGTLRKCNDTEIIKQFLHVRKQHLIQRFKRLASLEKTRIERESELIRFIREKWNQKVTKLSDRQELLSQLKAAQFQFGEYLSAIPLYRLTLKELAQSKASISQAKLRQKEYIKLSKKNQTLHAFIKTEIEAFVKKWDGPKSNSKPKPNSKPSSNSNI